ncbi:MAG: NAD-dependent epimerase/dehydratase family protein, partial [Chitinophagales bacterium]|nr:NAD-dependent epimerase/dehydratase family protein [Chitinophagales bacterium]
MKTILITGGTGLIGQALTQLLQKEGFAVTYLSRKRSNGKP